MDGWLQTMCHCSSGVMRIRSTLWKAEKAIILLAWSVASWVAKMIACKYIAPELHRLGRKTTRDKQIDRALMEILDPA